MTQRISAQLNLLNHLQTNLSGRQYSRYGQLFKLDCQTPQFLMMAHNSEMLFVEICEIHDFEWKKPGTQHHGALGVGERYHGPIRHTFRKLQIDHPKLQK